MPTSSPSPFVEARASFWTRRVAYGLFGGLFAFENLNGLRWLTFNIDYTWRGRIVSTAFTFLVLFALDIFFKKRLRLRLPAIAWLAGAIIIIVDFSGDVFHLYSQFAWYDRVAHFCSGPLLVAGFAFVLERIAQRLDWRQPWIVTGLLALGINGLLATLYEIEEYLEDLAFGTHRLGDGFDTADDLLMSLLGGLLALAVIAAARAWKRQTPSSEGV